MAGAGYKLFNTGDVLTAAQVNQYLMEQSVMVFADAAARTTALSGVVAEGMLSYLKDTNAVEVYDGANWVASDDPNAIQNTIVDAKGDLVAASADNVPARLAVGNNGETLVADSSTTTGLRYKEDYAAGKNKIINGNMVIDQRNSAASAISVAANADIYSVDRWSGIGQAADGVFSLGQDTSAPDGFSNSLKVTITTADASIGSTQGYSFRQKIEGFNVADLAFGTAAAKTITLSFWVRSSVTGDFGGSIRNSAGNRSFPFLYNIAIADTWEKKSITIAGDTSGTWLKTTGVGLNLAFSLGAGSSVVGTAGAWAAASYIGATGQTQLISTLNATLYITGVQVEAGSVATAFQTATGTLAGELAACQRYYFQMALGTTRVLGTGLYQSSTRINQPIIFPITMRIAPSLVATSGTNYYNFQIGTDDNFNSLTISSASTQSCIVFNNTEVSGTAGQAGATFTNNAASSVAFNAEL